MRDKKLPANKLNLFLVLFSAGTIRLKLQGFTIGELKLSKDGFIINLAEKKEVRQFSKILPKDVKSLSFLKQASSLMDYLNISLEMRDKKGTVIGLGKGHHSMMGKLNMKVLKSLEYFR